MIREIFKKDYRGYLECPKRSVPQVELKYTNTGNRDEIRRNLMNDFQSKCGYCGWKYEYGCEQFHIEHIKCKDKHKELIDDYNNFALSCPICNKTKGNRTLEETINIDPTTEYFRNYFYRNKFGAIVENRNLGETDLEIANQIKTLFGLSKEIHKIDYLYECLEYILENSIKEEDIEVIRKVYEFQKFIKNNFVRKTKYII